VQSINISRYTSMMYRAHAVHKCILSCSLFGQYLGRIVNIAGITQIYQSSTRLSTHGMSHSCLCSPPAERRHILASIHCVKLSVSG